MTTFAVVVPIAPARTPRVLPSLERLAGPSHEVVVQVGPNPSRNRNLGIARSEGTILAFTDDDCEVAPDWLARAAAFFARHPDYDVVGGPQLNGVDEGLVGRASGHALASRFGAHRQSRRYRRAAASLHATQLDLSSANLFVTRRAFERWGPFDERLWPNEETALLRRIEADGGRIAYDPTLVVFHKRRASLAGLARQCFGYGRGRARQARIEGTRPGIGQTVPAAFLLYLALLPWSAFLGRLALAPLALYGVVSLTTSLAIAVRRGDPAIAPVLPLAFLAIHLGYPAGLWAETLQRAGVRLAPPDVAADKAVAR